MTKQFVNAEIKSESTPVRGYSKWGFNFPIKWNDFYFLLKEEMKKGTHEDGLYMCSKSGVWVLQDRDFDSCAVILNGDAAVDITTAWSGFKYHFYNKEGHVALLFDGPRRALGTQNLLPKEVKVIIGNIASDNPFMYLSYMRDAEGNSFHPNEVEAFYKSLGWRLSTRMRWSGWWEEDK